MRILVLVFLLVFTVQASPSINWQTYGVIFKGQQAKALLGQCSRAAPQKVSAQWTPSSQQIEQLETKLAAYRQKIKRPAAQLNRYYRQYAGFIAGGRKIIYVNFFLNSVGSFYNVDGLWRSQAVTGCDGGENFWGVEFEVKTGQFVNAAFNGIV